jgi:hypothetical protein
MRADVVTCCIDKIDSRTLSVEALNERRGRAVKMRPDGAGGRSERAQGWASLVGTRDLALQAIKVLLVGWLDPGSDELLVLHRIERLLPTHECLAALTGKRDAENKVVVLRNMLDLDPVWWLDGLEDVRVRVVGPVRSVHDESPGSSGSEIERLECAGEPIRSPPTSEALSPREGAEYLLWSRVDKS